MAKAQIVLADVDESYLAPLERKFTEEFKFDASIQIISDPGYLAHFFSTQQSIDIFVVGSEMYSPEFMRHNIQNLFVLSETPVSGPETAGQPFHSIYKYTSAKEIFDTVISRSGADFAARLHSDTAQVLLSFSAGGGLGQTTISAGLAGVLAQNFRRVLFLGMDSLQTFGAFMQNPVRLQPGAEKPFVGKSDYVFEALQPLIVSELFDFLPPFASSLASLGIGAPQFIHLIDCIKKSSMYDCIVVDGPNELSEHATKMMAYVNQTMLVAAQDGPSVYKLDCLMDNIDCSDHSRFSLICNKYNPAAENFLINGKGGHNYPTCEYVDFEPEMHLHANDCGWLAGLGSMKKMGQLFL